MDLALVSSIFVLQHPGFVRVGNICIASKGPIRSVRLFHSRPLEEVQCVGLDAASRTSVVLGKIILERHLHLSPEYVPLDEAEGFPASGTDAAVVIGDRSFKLTDRGISSLDLGEAWREYTGLPFVFAFWTGRRDRDWEDVAQRLGQVRDRNLADSDAVSHEASDGWGLPLEFCREYLTQNVHYTFGPEEANGLERFFAEAEAFMPG
jgi:chorismate dehydratase